MLEKITLLQKEIERFSTLDKKGLEEFRLKYISKKGIVSELFEELKKV